MGRRRKKNIIIELTALLDVIMIMIFMVMNENSKLVSQAQSELSTVQQENAEQAEKIDELSTELADALEMLDEGDFDEIFERLKRAESRLDAYQAIDDEFIVLNIGLANNSNNTIRTLTYGETANPETIVNKQCNNDIVFNTACNNLKVFISDYVEQVLNDDSNSVVICVVFSYDQYKVYQRDFEVIKAILEDAEARASNSNFRCRINPVLPDK